MSKKQNSLNIGSFFFFKRKNLISISETRFLFDYSNLRASIGLSLAAFLAGRIPKIIPVQVVITKVVRTIF
jgi:hypothetical protein